MPDSPTGPLVLIVEDNPANLLLVETVLRRGGFRTAAARSGHEMWTRIGLSRPDLVLMDIQLPGEDGLTLARHLKATDRTATLPIVVLTAHAMKADRARALEAGCDGYVAKPIDTRTFAAELAAILRKHQTPNFGEERPDAR
ncbi:MAG TPA: response regulator [Chloroflexota bacterium]|nr:response regulator [Chloroflexota bacterium]